MSNTPATTPSERPLWGTRAFVEHTMGMAISLHVRALTGDLETRAEELADAAERAFAELRRADDVFSPYRADSELMRMRRGELDAADADPWFAEVTRLCEEAASVTQGLFTTDLVGPDGTRGFDPTGLVKGFAVERAADVLRAVPGIVFCLNAGGDLTADVGRSTDGAGPDARIDRTWRIGIADPDDPQGVVATLDLTTGALATSGTAQRGEHIVDPRAEASIQPDGATPRRTRSVTVVGPDLVWADVWATVCFLDPDVLAFSRMAASYRMVHSL